MGKELLNICLYILLCIQFLCKNKWTKLQRIQEFERTPDIHWDPLADCIYHDCFLIKPEIKAVR
jgi:hypothetical protein